MPRYSQTHTTEDRYGNRETWTQTWETPDPTDLPSPSDVNNLPAPPDNGGNGSDNQD